jgi:hypothetical protein
VNSWTSPVLIVVVLFLHGYRFWPGRDKAF